MFSLSVASAFRSRLAVSSSACPTDQEFVCASVYICLQIRMHRRLLSMNEEEWGESLCFIRGV